MNQNILIWYSELYSLLSEKEFDNIIQYTVYE